ncbi:lipase secretion chaperone [Pseudomonas sp. Gutcm_11s]|uniref:lipase secretion chaperone n=1 Tax=Pseudomonas sp. Gutcm_11s TaxID=3026088 RepID=UPI00236059D7|nr:lipase secretion chaperone [Pseudomonas sp. Gutcm_11s]MDD0843995.1 lipase secretion chaperone [Pseudomonas sp. Gutcm_11s]
MSNRIILAALALGAVVVGSTLVLYRPDLPLAAQPSTAPQAIVPPGDERSQQASTLNQRLRATPSSQLSDPGPLPPSLLGTAHGVVLRMDAQGNLVLQDDLLRLFDFYLAGREEEGLDKVLTRIHRDLAAQLRTPALEQARDLLSRYVDYRIALQNLPEADASMDPGALRQRLDALNAARQQYFSAEEYALFFARENAEDEYMVQRLGLAQQSGLSEEQRAQALAELELQLPEDVRTARAESMRYGELYAATQDMQEKGASAEEIRQLREQSLGSEAADALAELDQQQAKWQQRLSDYASERNRLRQSGLSGSQLQAAVEELQASRFDELERLRVQALDAEL